MGNGALRSRTDTMAISVDAQHGAQPAGMQSPASVLNRIDYIRLALIVCLLTAFALHTAMLDAKSLWLDEVLTVRTVDSGQSAFWRGKSESYHPPLYYWLLEQWQVAGQNAYAWRFPSAYFGTLAIALVFALANSMAGQATALTAIWLAALSPLHLWYAQEMRNYSLLLCLASLSATALIRFLLRPAAGWYLLLIVGTTAALYTHYLAILLMPIHLLLFVILHAAGKTNWRNGAVALAVWPISLLLFVPWLRTDAAARTLDIVTGRGSHYTRLFAHLTGSNLRESFVPLAIAAVALGIVGLALLGWLLHRRGDELAGLRYARWVRAGVLAAFYASLVVLLVPRGYTAKRQLLILWPFVLLFLGWVWPWQRSNSRPILTMLLLSLAASMITLTAIPKDQWREAVAYLNEQSESGDVVALVPSYMSTPFDYYDQGRLNRVGIRPADMDEILPELAEQHGRIWLVYHSVDTVDAGRNAEAWLEQHGHLIREAPFFRIHAKLFEMR